MHLFLCTLIKILFNDSIRSPSLILSTTIEFSANDHLCLLSAKGSYSEKDILVVSNLDNAREGERYSHY